MQSESVWFRNKVFLLYDSAYYKRVLRKNGVRVVSATEAISEGAEGILLESLLEGVAEYYSVELAEKTLRGMTENALNCKVDGRVPLGYAPTEDKHYQIDPIWKLRGFFRISLPRGSQEKSRSIDLLFSTKSADGGINPLLVDEIASR